MESLIGSLKADIQEFRKDFTSALKELRKDVTDIGQRVPSLEESNDVRCNELELLRKETATLQDQLLDLQAHTEDIS